MQDLWLGVCLVKDTPNALLFLLVSINSQAYLVEHNYHIHCHVCRLGLGLCQIEPGSSTCRCSIGLEWVWDPLSTRVLG